MRMWGGRFEAGPDAIMEAINVSIDVDRHLYAQDIAASKAHAAMLAKQGIIAADDAKSIAEGLDAILSEITRGTFTFKRALEDIHMNVESRLGELIGPADISWCSLSIDSPDFVAAAIASAKAAHIACATKLLMSFSTMP